MAEEQHGFIVRDRNGGLVEYYGKNTVSFDATDGGIVTFTKGVAVENVPILLDFSAGDQSVRVDDGYLVKSAVIEKPIDLVAENIRRGKVIANIEGDFIGDTEEITVDGDNDLNFAGGDGDFVVEPSSEEKVISKVTISKPSELIPDNIAKGVTIAGVEGTHSGTQEIVQVKGSYTPTVSGNVTIEHNLGVIPDIIMVRANASAGGYIANIIGFAEEIARDGYFQKIQTNNSYGLVGMDGKINIFSDSDSNGMIHSATPKIFKVGGSSLAHEVGKIYSWTVIGGLVHRQGYFFMSLALDGNGNLIVTGGVPAIQQLKIYVDGTLAKTVDYAHADEVTIDISDVAGEFQEYTITVEGVGENLNSQYPYSFYDTVTGYTISLGGTCGASAYWRLTGDGTLTIYGEGAMDGWNTDNVATDKPWYNYNSIITGAIIEYGITNLGAYALRDCTNLTSVILADSVISIGGNSLRNTAITSITIPSGVTSIPISMFYGCTALRSVTIPDNVTSIGNYAFYNCTSLTSISIPDSVTSIGSYAFASCTSLTSISIPDSVTSIGSYAFRECGLTSIYIPDSVTTFGADSNGYWQTFRECPNLSEVRLPSGLTSIGGSMFYNCSALTSITIPDSVTSIGDYAFRLCGFTSITIPANVVNIGKYAFYSSQITSAIFAITTGWKRGTSSTSITTSVSSTYMSNTTTVATYLKSTYASYYWKRT